MSFVTCHMSSVIYHLSPTPTPTATATDPPPANSPTVQSRLVFHDRHICLGEPAYLPKNHFFLLQTLTKMSKPKEEFLSPNLAIWAIFSLTRSLYFTRFQVPDKVTNKNTNTHTHSHSEYIDWIGIWDNLVELKLICLFCINATSC